MKRENLKYGWFIPSETNKNIKNLDPSIHTIYVEKNSIETLYGFLSDNISPHNTPWQFDDYWFQILNHPKREGTIGELVRVGSIDMDTNNMVSYTVDGTTYTLPKLTYKFYLKVPGHKEIIPVTEENDLILLENYNGTGKLTNSEVDEEDLVAIDHTGTQIKVGDEVVVPTSGYGLQLSSGKVVDITFSTPKAESVRRRVGKGSHTCVVVDIGPFDIDNPDRPNASSGSLVQFYGSEIKNVLVIDSNLPDRFMLKKIKDI